MNEQHGVALAFDGSITSGAKIRSFAEIPDIIGMKFPRVEYIVPALGIARNTITLWTGADGDGKTYLAQAMAIAVARGDAFLGMACLQSPVLYLDLENPAYVVQDRLQPMTSEESIPKLRIWGIWNDQQPPTCGSELLLTIAKETQPLIIIDPFRFFHNAKENDSDEMSAVMQYLRACARYGGAVVIMHHPAKTEGSTGRGSTVIRGACDLAFLHSLDRESSLITIKVDKNRNGESRTITLRADFEEGYFEVTDAPYITKRNDELERLAEIIRSNPGLSQNSICSESGMAKARCVRLLQEGRGKRWRAEKDGRSFKYLPIGSGSENRVEPSEPTRVIGSTVLSSLEENREPFPVGTPIPKPNGNDLTQCAACQSYAVYREQDGRVTCMTCEVTQ
jgi:archaellum biogenesis ATPase FlaH